MPEATNQLEILVKLFQHKQHADDFRKGIVFAKPLSYFQKLEGQHGISDPFEGSMYSDEKGIVKIGISPDKMVDITSSLQGPVRFRRINHVNIVCFHLWRIPILMTNNTEPLLDNQKAKEGIPIQLQEEFGSHLVVIHNMVEFINRVKTAVEQLYANNCVLNYRGDRITYEDHKPIVSVNSNSLTAAFYKRKKFAYQNEYRMAFELPAIKQKEERPFKFNIGNIEDITMADNSNQQFEFCVVTK